MCEVFSKPRWAKQVMEGNIQEAQRRTMQLVCKCKVGEGQDSLGKEPRQTLPGSSGNIKNKPQIRRTNTSFTELTTHNLMTSQIMFLKVVHQWHSWQLTWIRMVQSIHYRPKTHISIAATQGAQAIKLWHCLYITRPCVVYLGLQG